MSADSRKKEFAEMDMNSPKHLPAGTWMSGEDIVKHILDKPEGETNSPLKTLHQHMEAQGVQSIWLGGSSYLYYLPHAEKTISRQGRKT